MSMWPRQLAIDRAKQLFDCAFANVQPHSGAQANQAVFLALLQAGRHHPGHEPGCRRPPDPWRAPPTCPANGSTPCSTACGATTGCSTTRSWSASRATEKPKLIIAGGSAYPRFIDFARIRKVADEVGAYLHGGHGAFRRPGRRPALFPSPLPHAHVVTTTTHKTLRGPRGGMILSNDPDIGKKINSAVFPGLQGGPLMHVIAGKAAAFGEALRPEFRTYQKAVRDNARVLAETLDRSRAWTSSPAAPTAI